MPVYDEYQVKLDAFCGPLDLLLFLIRRAEVDVHDVAISTITDQYLTFLRQVDDIDIEAAGDFLVMAATLMEIKSRTLMPVQVGEAGEGNGVESAVGVDPRFELVKQLLEYQRYRMASETLNDGRREFARQFPSAPFQTEPEPENDDPPALELDDAHIYDLF